MKKILLTTVLMLAISTSVFAATRDYTLVSGQTDKTERDEVEVSVQETATFINDSTLTALQIKAEIARLDTKAAVVAAAKAELERILIDVYVEVDKYELVEK